MYLKSSFITDSFSIFLIALSLEIYTNIKTCLTDNNKESNDSR